MKFVAPVVLILVLSGALYKTQEILSKAEYDAHVDPEGAARRRVRDYTEPGLKQYRARGPDWKDPETEERTRLAARN